MTLNASGPISLAGTTAGQSIEIENGGNGTTQISLNCTAVRSLAGVPSGAITMPTNFYGKSNAYNYTISSNQTNFCMRAGAISAGWNGTQALNVTIQSGVKISASSTSPAMTISGAYPGGVTVKNQGTIVGLGGNGGKAGGLCNPTASYSGQPGSSGSTALKISSTVTICNASGIIAGGGGGGGGGALGCYYCEPGDRRFPVGGGGGGGGRSSLTNSSGGGGGCSCPRPAYNGSPGNPGTFCAAGTGGGGYSTSGGSGGTWGASGNGGTSGGAPAGSGGSGGKATCGTSFVTWTATGTRYGSVS
jgi:hypothetical protein